MSNLHPHWQEEDEVPVQVRTKETVQPETTNARPVKVAISRRPAAMVGMLLVIAIGYGFFQGTSSLTGQVAPSGPTIAITNDGITPSRIEVEHGQTITFVNESDTDHVLESNTLCGDTGYCLRTSTLHRGDRDTFSITPDMRSGPYEFMSTTSGDIRGVIIIVTQTVDNYQDFTSVLEDSFAPPPSPFDSLPPSTFEQNAIASTAIPQNPYAIDSQRIHPFDTNGDPIAEAFGDAPGTVMAQATFAQTQGPLSQPQTGAEGVTVIACLSVALLWYFSRGSIAVA